VTEANTGKTTSRRVFVKMVAGVTSLAVVGFGAYKMDLPTFLRQAELVPNSIDTPT
jgi:hypothetical protein